MSNNIYHNIDIYVIRIIKISVAKLINIRRLQASETVT